MVRVAGRSVNKSCRDDLIVQERAEVCPVSVAPDIVTSKGLGKLNERIEG